MKTAKSSLLCLIFSWALLTPTFGAIRSTGHQEYSAQLSRAIDWTKHVLAEVRRGKKMNRSHVAIEVRDTNHALSEMRDALSKAKSEPPAHGSDGHMQQLRQHQQSAEDAAAELEEGIRAKRPNYAKLNDTANRLLVELRNLQHWHELELSEKENKLHD